MYCFEIKPTAGYTGGCAIIAATTVEEAIKEFCKDSYNDYIYDFVNCTCNIIPGLDYNTDTPKIIISSIYIE